ncbi:AAA family ATPase [Photobacterium sp. SDRW27]|uniref:SPOR domain-containing protein n=1 Tax=Photobacterium obscurum TaxID=2829490 RepID=UPI002243E269|nr:AAA family ATPase [Photobacterium obscurum]MCW8329645.1 AAA family ATPase [Photobacterium obscurum]
MTRGTQVAMLDLDSQIQLLSRIQFLTRFSSNLIQITGSEGAGKTWLAQRYLELWADNSNQALLLCHPAQNDSQHRSILLKQLVAQPLFNDQDPLQQSVERMLEGSPVNLLLVIDDAHLLSPALIAELWALVQKAQSEPGWQINVLLFSQRERLNKYLSQVSHGQGTTPLELEITDFTEQEVQTFVEVMFTSDQLDANGRRALKEKASISSPTPGALMQLDQTEQSNMAGSSSRRISPVALLVILLAVAVAGVVFWLFPATEQDTAEEQSEHPQAFVEEVQEPVLSSGRFDEPEPVGDLLKSEEPDNTVESDDSHSLPPEVSLEGLTVGRSEENQRVVVPSDVVDAMISEQALGGSGEQAVAESAMEAISPETASEPPLPEPEQPVPASNTSSTEPVIETTNVKSDVVGTELKTIDQRHYALQLAALKSMTAANNFIADYGIAQIATIYETRRNGEPWFIIITGDYPDMLSARRAETRLPERLQAVQPWVKSYAQIHREIERVK